MLRQDPEHREFVRLLTGAQRRIYAYILTLVPDRNAAEDILQDTNLALWEQADRFAMGTNFVAWACRVAHFTVLTARKRNTRQRLRFDDTVLERLAAESIDRGALFEDRREALMQCMEALSADEQKLIARRYRSAERVQDIAEDVGKTPAAVSQSLLRLRTALLRCIDRAVEAEESA